MREPLLVLDGALCVVSASRSFHETFGTTPQESVGRSVYELAERQMGPSRRCGSCWSASCPTTRPSSGSQIDRVAPDGTARKLYLSGRRIEGGLVGDVSLILLAFER